jgi:hypothetical protein
LGNMNVKSHTRNWLHLREVPWVLAGRGPVGGGPHAFAVAARVPPCARL